MYFDKRYLQFNDLVFDGYDMISDADEPIQYKGSSTAISYGHGSYRAFKNDYLYVSERQVNMTITLMLKKIPCDYRKFYAQFAEQELGKPGRLWAIKNNEILWAMAAVTNIRPVHTNRRYELVYDVELVVPGGVWHKADKLKTFVLPYDVCALMDCKGFEEYDPCANTCIDCCDSCLEKKATEDMRDRCGCCCEDDLTEDMALCYHQHELQAFYGCDTPYQLVYSCMAAEKFSKERALGQKLCVSDICNQSVIAGRIYSNTDIPTENMTITLIGDMQNPRININGNVNAINGEYSGTLVITPSGDIYYTPCGKECCEPELLSPVMDDGETPRWVIPSGMNYGWTLKPKLNSVIVELNACCSQCGLACVFLDHEGITL